MMMKNLLKRLSVKKFHQLLLCGKLSWNLGGADGLYWKILHCGKRKDGL